MGGQFVNTTPTFRWDTVLTPAVDPVIGAASYRIKISTDPNFSTQATYNETRETDTNTYTPYQNPYADGTYYWKVCMLDASGNEGTYSEVNTVTKQYPTVNLESPPSGSQIYEVQFENKDFYNRYSRIQIRIHSLLGRQMRTCE